MDDYMYMYSIAGETGTFITSYSLELFPIMDTQQTQSDTWGENL